MGKTGGNVPMVGKRRGLLAVADVLVPRVLLENIVKPMSMIVQTICVQMMLHVSMVLTVIHVHVCWGTQETNVRKTLMTVLV